jgi:UDP-glucose:(heptosyl)LPS alpha-1,3-glucosyltransferase
MKIALIRRQFTATGGAELYLQRLIAALAAAGHDLHLFAEDWRGEPEGVKLHRIAAASSRAQRPLRFAQELERVLKQDDFDTVFSLERTLRQDVYRAGDGLHRVWLEQRRRYAPWWKRLLIGRGSFHRNVLNLEQQVFAPARTRHVIVNSVMVRDEILRHFGFPAERIHLVRNGVDVTRFQSGDRDRTRQRFGLKPDDFVLLFVGSGWERKGLSFLIRLMRQLEQTEPNLRLLVVGKGRWRGRLPSNVILAGPLARVEDAYAAADLLTFLPIYEPSANVVPEALASGLPVITSCFNGAAEWLQEGINGHVLDEPSDTAALEQAVRFWLNRRHVRPVPCAQPLDLDTNVRETLRVLEIAATDRPRSS